MESLEIDWGTILSSAGGGGLVLALAKGFISSALRELRDIRERINDILIQLASMTIKLEALEQIQQKIFDHESAIIKLGSRISRDKNRFSKDH